MDTACLAVGDLSGNGVPRSDRVDLPGPPAQTTLSSLNTASHPTLPLSPPAVPARSPLRPPARSISSQSQASSVTNSRSSRALLDTPPLSEFEDSTAIVDSSASTAGLPMPEQDPSFPSIDDLLEAVGAVSVEETFPKSIHVRPDSPVTVPLDGRSRVPRKSESPSSSVSVPTQATSQSTMTKRQHALHELLSSERAYASDLALIREVHIPLALGQAVPLQSLPASPPDSSASSSRTLSTASDSSTASLGPPMTQDDARIIFSNITELALFSDSFCDKLEEALGSVVKGGIGDDHVGELFLRIIPELERPYQHYITRHPTALQHLQNLPSTPALQTYLLYTQNVASSLSHAWDLASLLIKPVQRLLKYPLLLSAIIDETPDEHPDKQKLKHARSRMEEVARNVNETRRRAEVVKDVLASKKKSVNVTVAATVNLSKMKRGSTKSAHSEENGEAAQVERMTQELKRIELFAQQFAKNVVEWSRSMSKVVSALRIWAVTFGRVIGLSAEHGSEAFEAFLMVVQEQLMPLCVDLEAIINERLLKEIAHLLKTMNHPYKLIASMQDQEPFHWHLLNMNVSSKNRPPPALLAASTNYLALRAQLASELPTYLALLHRGMAVIVRTLADMQTRFWKDIKDRWSELWEMLRVEGELNAGHDETVNVWRSRWLDVDEVVASLNINQAKKIYQEPERARPTSTSSGLHSMLSSLEPGHAQRRLSNSTKDPSSSFYPSSHISSPYPLAPSSHSRGRRSRDDPSYFPSPRSLSRRNSNDSLLSDYRKGKGKSPRRKSREGHTPIHDAYSSHPYAYDQLGELPASSIPAIPRRKSMPLPSEVLGRSATAIRRNTSPAPAYGHSRGGEGFYHGPQIYHPYSAPVNAYENNRESESPVPVSRASSTKKPDSAKQRPSHNRQRSSSVTSFFKVEKENKDAPPLPYSQHEPGNRPLSQSQRDSWSGKPAKYICTVIHPCHPPPNVTYFSFPFFTLCDGELYEVLQEAGHPSIHPKLPLYVDEGEDCLLLCRNGHGQVGWALASFLEPINIPE